MHFMSRSLLDLSHWATSGGQGHVPIANQGDVHGAVETIPKQNAEGFLEVSTLLSSTIYFIYGSVEIMGDGNYSGQLRRMSQTISCNCTLELVQLALQFAGDAECKDRDPRIVYSNLKRWLASSKPFHWIWSVNATYKCLYMGPQHNDEDNDYLFHLAKTIVTKREPLKRGNSQQKGNYCSKKCPPKGNPLTKKGRIYRIRNHEEGKDMEG